MRRFALIAFALASASTPVAAQYVSDVEPFLNAVRERDGTKATDVLESRPAVVNGRNAKGETALTIVIALAPAEIFDAAFERQQGMRR